MFLFRISLCSNKKFKFCTSHGKTLKDICKSILIENSIDLRSIILFEVTILNQQNLILCHLLSFWPPFHIALLVNFSPVLSVFRFLKFWDTSPPYLNLVLSNPALSWQRDSKKYFRLDTQSVLVSNKNLEVRDISQRSTSVPRIGRKVPSKTNVRRRYANSIFLVFQEFNFL